MTAIICCINEQKEKRFLKYRNIHDRDYSLRNFYNFLDRQFPDWIYINFYGGVSRNYLKRHYRNASKPPTGVDYRPKNNNFISFTFNSLP